MFEGSRVSYARKCWPLIGAHGTIISIIDDDIIPHIEFLEQVRTDSNVELSGRGVRPNRALEQADMPFALQRGTVEKDYESH